MKSYTIERVKGGLKFTCTRCKHHVSTLDFNLSGGNLRTQAASTINQHASTVHNEPLIVSAPDIQQRIWRS